MPKQALVVYGGWPGHKPFEVAKIFERVLREEKFDVVLSDSLATFGKLDQFTNLSLIIPHWSMGKLDGEASKKLQSTVAGKGVGLAGCHGGMCDAFREDTGYQLMTGGQWVAHPGDDGTKYRVRIIKGSHAIVDGIDDFDVSSEQYYMHTDPSNRTLATTEMPVAPGPHDGNGKFDMPVIWTRHHGKGRVFYNSLGHQPNVIDSEPCLTIIRRGFLWAAK